MTRPPLADGSPVVAVAIPTTTRAADPHDLPVGTRVLAFGGTRDARAVITVTRSEVWRLGHGVPVVKVAGIDGGIALSHIEVIP